MKRLALASVVPLAFAVGALAQPRGGVLRGRLLNGTSGGPGRAEKVTLFRLAEEMVPAHELSDVSGSFEIADIVVEGQRPMLLQATYEGVNYNQPVRFGRGYEAEAEVTVYDVRPDWDDASLEITTSRFLYRRQGDRLRVDKVFVVMNRSSPPVTHYDPEGTFRVNLPTSKLVELRSVSARGTSGMPVPQQASPLAGGGGYALKTAFKPGETEIAVSYDVDYGEGRYAVEAEAFHPLSELLVFVAPPDVGLDAPGWQNLGPEPEGRFVTLRRADVPVGDSLDFEISGGSAEAPPLGPATESESTGDATPSGTVTRIPDTTRAEKWVLILLMAAALAYGLLSILYPSKADRG